jgi:hypothetical protein
MAVSYNSISASHMPVDEEERMSKTTVYKHTSGDSSDTSSTFTYLRNLFINKKV